MFNLLQSLKFPSSSYPVNCRHFIQFTTRHFFVILKGSHHDAWCPLPPNSPSLIAMIRTEPQDTDFLVILHHLFPTFANLYSRVASFLALVSSLVDHRFNRIHTPSSCSTISLKAVFAVVLPLPHRYRKILLVELLWLSGWSILHV